MGDEKVTLVTYMATVRSIVQYLDPTCRVFLTPKGLRIDLYDFGCVIPLEDIIDDILDNCCPSKRILFLIEIRERLDNEHRLYLQNLVPWRESINELVQYLVW